MKIYKFDPQRYFFAVILPTIFMFVILIYAVINNLKTLDVNIYSLCIVITVYGLFNNIAALSNPSIITDDGKEIRFYSFGRYHTYSLDKIQYIRIKEFYGRKMYLRIDNHSLFKGRYWIKTIMYNDRDELYEKFTSLERKLHPNLLKFRTKISNEKKDN